MLSDEHPEAAKSVKKKSIGLDSPRDIAALRTMIDNPLYKRVGLHEKFQTGVTHIHQVISLAG